jgi:NAD-dependent DNA ligase
MGNNRGRAEVAGARDALNHLKSEVAAELGVPNYEELDKGALPSRLNGKVGGVMVRKMIEFAEEAMMHSPEALQAVEAEPGATQQDAEVAQQSLRAAEAFMNGFVATGTFDGAARQDALTPRAMQGQKILPNPLGDQNPAGVPRLEPPQTQ